MNYQITLFVRRNLDQIKHCTCPKCGKRATLVVDVESETTPETDEQGHLRYYCTHCHNKFTVAAQA